MTLTGYIVGAKGNTGRSISGVTENNDYTITISFTDGTTFTTDPIPGFTSVDLDENFDLVVTKTDGTEVTVETGLGEYNTTLSGYKTDAENAATSAGQSKTAAEGSAGTATAQATLARSYAKGDTSSRTGEATDNAEYFKGQASDSATSASSSASTAEAQALISEGYAQGTQVSTPVTSESPYYHNNSKYYSELASASDTSAASSASSANTDALKAEGYAVGKQNGTTQTGGTYYHNNAQYYNSQATQAASISATQATASGTQALKSEGFAVGEQSGTPVTSGSDYYENNAKYYAGEAADSATAAAASAASIDPDTLAKIDGYYQEMTVGDAEQLVSSVLIEDKVPYNFRTAGGSADIGARAYFDAIVGGTVAWNQLYSKTNTATDAGVTYTNTNGTIVPSGTSTGDSYYSLQISGVPSGHKILFTGGDKNASYTDCYSYVVCNGSYYNLTGGVVSLILQTNGNNMAHNIRTVSGVNTTALNRKFTPQVFDLTAMFGSTIADYIYTLETGTAGAGVAFFRKLFPKPYYAYNAGSLESVNTSAHVTTGFNQWDEEWRNGFYTPNGVFVAESNYVACKNPIRVCPQTAYNLHSGSGYFGRICYFDADNTLISTATNATSNTDWSITTPSGCYYIVFDCVGAYGNTYKNDICINLHWDGSRDGEYEAYTEHSYALDDSLTLRGIPKLDASNKLYFDGDTYEADGTVTRKYGIVDLGTLYWYYDDTNQRFYASSFGAKDSFKGICSKYPFVGSYTNLTDKTCSYIYLNSIGVKDSSYTDAATFKTAMSGVYLVYELATPTTESADSYNGIQIVNDFGTERFVDAAVADSDRDVEIPVGHVTNYPNNLVAKLEMMPNSPDGDGLYVVQQDSGINTYVTLPVELPTKPTVDGTYHLKCTVASGTPTLTWEGDE